MQRPAPLTFATLVTIPESYSAKVAAQRLVEIHSAGRKRRGDCPNPLFLHGPAGSGKTHLASALAGQWIRREPASVVTVLAAADWNALAGSDRFEAQDAFHEIRRSDL